MRNVVLWLSLIGSCWMVGATGACKDKDDPDAASGSSKAISTKDDKTAKFEHCGKVVCRAGRECCNESCGICTEPEVACTAQICESGEGISALAPECGGSAERPCPGEGRCVNDEGERCDPSDGAECGGTCACAASARCPAGARWNAAPQVCGCEIDDSAGDDDGEAGSGGGDDEDDPPASGQDAGGGTAGGNSEAGEGGQSGGGSGNDAGVSGQGGSGGSGGPVVCGDVTCASGQVCCNASCSICAPPGDACITQICEPPMGGAMAPPPCGSTTCAAGQVCCDPACGLCAPDSASCKDIACTDPGPHPGDLCDLRCGAGERCEYVAVTCIRAPCPPVPECVPFVPCGGTDGVLCPGSGTCVDDTSDNCDPQTSRIECAGKCVCSGTVLRLCKANFHWEPSPAVCACVANPRIECIPQLPCES
jgi:hypothetical protein